MLNWKRITSFKVCGNNREIQTSQTLLHVLHTYPPHGAYLSYSCKILLSVVWGKPKSITSSISSYTVTKLSRMLSSSSSLKYSLNTYRYRRKHKALKWWVGCTLIGMKQVEVKTWHPPGQSYRGRSTPEQHWRSSWSWPPLVRGTLRNNIYGCVEINHRLTQCVKLEESKLELE